MNIFVRPKALASTYSTNTAWACISIVTHINTWPIFAHSNPDLLLQMHFADSDRSPEGEFSLIQSTQVFDEYMARAIIEFYQKVEKQAISELLVHCEAGWSRSPAVAGALSKIFLGDDTFFFQKYSPNMYVYRLIINEAAKMDLIG